MRLKALLTWLHEIAERYPSGDLLFRYNNIIIDKDNRLHIQASFSQVENMHVVQS